MIKFEEMVDWKEPDNFITSLADFWNKATITDYKVRVADMGIKRVDMNGEYVTLILPKTIDDFVGANPLTKHFGNNIKIELNVPLSQLLDKLNPEGGHLPSFFRGYTGKIKQKLGINKEQTLKTVMNDYRLQYAKEAGEKGRYKHMVFRVIQHPEYIRTPVVGGIVSPNYVPITDMDILGVITEFDEFRESQVTHPYFDQYGTKFGLIIRDPNHTGKLRVGEIFGQFTFRNSPWGNRSVGGDYGLWQLKCTNGMKSPFGAVDSIQISHLKKAGKTLEQSKTAILLELRLALEKMIDSSPKEWFEKIEQTVDVKVDEKLMEKMIEKICEQEGIATKHVVEIYATWENFYKAEPNLWGIIQSITRYANAVDSNNIQEDLQRLGGEMTLWEKLPELEIEVTTS